jgi:beta-barrel assembly-enhancing protease
MFVVIRVMILMLALSLAALQAQDARVADVAWRLQTANAALCPGERVNGVAVQARSQFAEDVGLGDRPVVAAVAAGSAAAKAGLRAGDEVLAVGGQATPVVAKGAGYAPVAATEAMLTGEMLNLQIRRGQMQQSVSFRPEAGCASVVQIIPGRRINAQADGRYVQINAGIIDFVTSDTELAAVVAHELAHNILKHRAKKTPSKQAEYEADQLSVALVARAGYRIDAVLPFWTRFEKRTSPGLFSDGTHPGSKKRLAALAAAVADLEASQSRFRR